ncbi:hypothetical protein HQ524_04610 [Candidatus Uhrbacteria bacterium]|nr:hypothetical protein [Candidatus Uhrbacteria bacterium]
MLPTVFLRGDGLYLRPVEESDAEIVTRWINDPDSRRWLSRVLPINQVREREWIAGMYKATSYVVLGIVISDGDRQDELVYSLTAEEWRARRKV